MHKQAWVFAAMTMAAVAAASAEDFPLQFKTIPPKDVLDFPGGSGAFASLLANPPTAFRKEPRAFSRHPLYGEFQLSGGEVLAFRLDESKGDGAGYDQLIVDLNQNGDLTDDPVAPRVAPPAKRAASSTSQPILFGPMEVAAGKAIAGSRPVCFAQIYLYNRTGPAGRASRAYMLPMGYVRLRAGWYLETTVESNGVKQKIGVYDGDCNLVLGDLAKPQITSSAREQTSWYFRGGDSWLVDANGSGAFEGDILQSEACPFGPMLYLGAKPCKAALSPDCKSVRIEPWTAPLAEVGLLPRGDQVRSVTLAWERASGLWELVRPVVAGGKISVPPGNYRLYSCDLLGKDKSRDQVMASATLRVPQEPVAFTAENANTLRCGGPLNIKVTASRTSATSGLFGLFSSDSAGASLLINATVTGAGGEVYSTYARGETLGSKPPRPVFRIMDAGGKEVGTGNLEFG